MRFVREVLSEELVVNNRKKTELLAELHAKNYQLFPPKSKSIKIDDDDDDDGFAGSSDSSNGDPTLSCGFDYLLSMKIWSLTNECVESLNANCVSARQKLDDLLKTTEEAMWMCELNALLSALDDYDKNELEIMNNYTDKKKKNKKKNVTSDDDGDYGTKTTTTKKRQAADVEDNDEDEGQPPLKKKQTKKYNS